MEICSAFILFTFSNYADLWQREGLHLWRLKNHRLILDWRQATPFIYYDSLWKVMKFKDIAHIIISLKTGLCYRHCGTVLFYTASCTEQNRKAKSEMQNARLLKCSILFKMMHFKSNSGISNQILAFQPNVFKSLHSNLTYFRSMHSNLMHFKSMRSNLTHFKSMH